MNVDAGAALHDAQAVRNAGRDLLSLALIDARNHLLHLLDRIEQHTGVPEAAVDGPPAPSPHWVAGHVAWLSEYWIARNPQRALGAAAPADGLRLASVEPRADGWFDPRLAGVRRRVEAAVPAGAELRAYLLDTLETTLELLHKAAEDDDGLYFFRMALLHEDLRREQLVQIAQSRGVALGLALPAARVARAALALPATRWTLGWQETGFALDVERGREAVEVPAFEIDAQAVSWAQYVEFIDDGGYDREALWHPAGWHWLQQLGATSGRRGPAHVEQIGVASGAVIQTLFGQPLRRVGAQAVVHASWWEADAFARWAGRRLPAEVEWEVAAHAAGRRGWHWGEVREWTAGTLRPWSGFAAAPWQSGAMLDSRSALGRARVLRGASFATPARLAHPRARAWAEPDADAGFTGFRTCAY